MDIMKEKIEGIDKVERKDKKAEYKKDVKRYRDDELLYHYTDFISLNGILKERELRVNNVLNMNRFII